MRKRKKIIHKQENYFWTLFLRIAKDFANFMFYGIFTATIVLSALLSERLKILFSAVNQFIDNKTNSLFQKLLEKIWLEATPVKIAFLQISMLIIIIYAVNRLARIIFKKRFKNA